MKKQIKNMKKGFTLIELVVVIAIIGILAAVITPRIRLSLYKARDSRAVASLDALRTASNVYFAEKGVPALTAGALDTLGIYNLGKGGYLDNQSARKFNVDLTANAPNAGTTITIETGVASKATSCVAGAVNETLTPTPLYIWVESDGVGMQFGDNATVDENGKFTSELYDTSCNPWSAK